jgi:hypothetical protein
VQIVALQLTIKAVPVERSRKNICGHLVSTCRYKAGGRFEVGVCDEGLRHEEMIT